MGPNARIRVVGYHSIYRNVEVAMLAQPAAPKI
jgi:hypothetical protein